MRKPNSLKFRLNSLGYIYAVFYASDGKIEVSIGRKCTKEQWDNETYDKGTARLISRLETLVDTYCDSKDNILSAILKSDIETIINEGAGKTVKKVKGQPLLEALTDYRDKINAGIIKKEDGNKYSPSTGRHIDALLTALQDTKYKAVPLEGFNNGHYEGIIQHFTDKTVTTARNKIKKRYSQNTICVYTVTLVKFFKRTRKLKWHNNSWYTDKDTSVKKDYVEGHVYLNQKELADIYALKLDTPAKTYARDLFILGCHICLRHTDISRLKNAVVKDGIMRILAKKGGRSVTIPLGAIAREIWDKYGGKFKPLDNAHFNDQIRDFCKAIGADEPCLCIRVEGGVKTEKIRPKYELCRSHTMRRSFATNAVKAGVPVPAIMRIGGWKTEDSFWKYIRMTNEENAEEMQKHAFFK